jgi:serine phosphatase RsbU (regulator of sigma subunit)
VRAGHEYPLLYDGTGASVVGPAGRSCPLGMYENVTLETQTAALLPGDILLL